MIGNKKAFTLIELLVVALALSIVVGATTGIFVSAIKVQKYNLEHQEIFNQVGYLANHMTRAIRTAVEGDGVCVAKGKTYEVSENHGQIKFIDSQGNCQEFLVTDQGLLFSRTNGQETLISSSNFDISHLEFNVIESLGGDKKQPRVTFIIEMSRFGSGGDPNIIIQTTVSKRNIDL